LDETLLSRVEDAGLNASAPPQQRWLDGWLVRFSPGKAKRARCINAVAEGRLPVESKLRLAAAVFDEAELPMVVRLTPFSRPPGLDDELAARGFTTMDDTRVMVCGDVPSAAPPLPGGCRWQALDHAAFAEAVGALRSSPPLQRRAHAERLSNSPVRYHGFAIVREEDEAVLACGQFAREAELVGLYDVFTDERVRNQGLARTLCQHLLSLAASSGARIAYLQVEADNTPARRIYKRLGFTDAYAYHYRVAAGAEA
jgi:GNAT superfamily N-acetyltransferase